MKLPRLARPAQRGVSSQATYGARRAVWTHHGPTRIHLADYSLRHQMDGSSGTTILYHLSIYRRPHSSSVMQPGAIGAWAPPPHPPGPQDLPMDYGPDGAAGGQSRIAPVWSVDD